MGENDNQRAPMHNCSMVDSAKSPPRTVAHVTRGVSRFLRSLNHSVLTEVVLASSRRADILSIGPTGEIWIIETKSSLEDLRVDRKWPEYRDYCDRLFFAADETVPMAHFPEETGFILADGYGAAILREAPEHLMAGARRKAVLIRVARMASNRLHMLNDPQMTLL